MRILLTLPGRAPGILVLALILGIPGCSGDPPPASDLTGQPWTEEREFRIALEVGSGGVRREAGAIVVPFDLPGLVAESDRSERADARSLTVVTIDPADGTARPVPFQYDPEIPGRTTGVIVLWSAAATVENEGRVYLAYFDGMNSRSTPSPGPAAPAAPEPLTLASVEHHEQPALRIESAVTTWIYHVRGAGLASIIDPDGQDWISWNPADGARGRHRGIPNLAYPEGWFHPGGGRCETDVRSSGPLRVVLDSRCPGDWAVAWEFLPRFARMTVVEADHPYWFLYEGTPGGGLTIGEDFVLRGAEWLPVDDERRDDLPGPEWTAFGDRRAGRALLLAHHVDDDHPDGSYAMEGAMTVFGFGRRRMQAFLDATPRSFTVMLADTVDADELRQTILGRTALRDVRIGRLQPRP